MTEPKKGGARRLAQQFTRAGVFHRLKDDAGAPWTSDGFVAIKYHLDPTDAKVYAREHDLSASRLIPEEKTRMFDQGEDADKLGELSFFENLTITTCVNREYHKRIMAAYPGAHVYLSTIDPMAPVSYLIGDEVVALLMPINLKKRDLAHA